MTTPATLNSQWVQFRSGRDTIRGYFAAPAGARALPGVVMAHENLGVTAHREEVTRRMAAAGFATLTVDLFSRIGGKPPLGMDHPNPAERRVKAFLAAADEQAVPDLDAGFDFLAARPEADARRIGTIGFCMGGGTCLVWATERADLRACVVLYGLPLLPPEYTLDHRARSRIAIADRIKCPYQGHFGEADDVIPLDQVRALEAAVRKSGQPCENYVYPGARHAYHDDTHPNFHPDAAARSWERSLEFLRTHLR